MSTIPRPEIWDTPARGITYLGFKAERHYEPILRAVPLAE
jgi:hypothetical protein